MAATEVRRSARSTAPGVSNGTLASATRALARVMRCSIAASLTRKARAICFTVKPETMRSASAICCVAEIGDRLVFGQRFLLAGAPDIIDRDVTANHDQPRRRIARRAVLRPRL